MSTVLDKSQLSTYMNTDVLASDDYRRLNATTSFHPGQSELTVVLEVYDLRLPKDEQLLVVTSDLQIAIDTFNAI